MSLALTTLLLRNGAEMSVPLRVSCSIHICSVLNGIFSLDLNFSSSRISPLHGSDSEQNASSSNEESRKIVGVSPMSSAYFPTSCSTLISVRKKENNSNSDSVTVYASFTLFSMKAFGLRVGRGPQNLCRNSPVSCHVLLPSSRSKCICSINLWVKLECGIFFLAPRH